MAAVAASATLAAARSAEAQLAEPWQLGLQEAHSPVMERIASFHDLLMVIITLITLFVVGLLAYACVKFSEKANPTPSKRTHAPLLEVVWTVVPVLILIVIAIPSFRLLYYSDVVPETELTVKAIGKQWYWTYEYPDHGSFEYDSYMLRDGDLGPDHVRLLSTDNALVLPAGVNIRLQVTAGDVLHSFAIPSLGLKLDAVPGRLNETWVHINQPGVYYGQCSELCGADHGFMPVELKALPPEEFEAWVTQAQEEYARRDGGPAAVLAQAE